MGTAAIKPERDLSPDHNADLARLYPFFSEARVGTLVFGSILGNLYRQLDVPEKLSRLGTIICQVCFVPAYVRFRIAGSRSIEPDRVLSCPFHESDIASQPVPSVDQISIPSIRKGTRLNAPLANQTRICHQPNLNIHNTFHVGMVIS